MSLKTGSAALTATEDTPAHNAVGVRADATSGRVGLPGAPEPAREARSLRRANALIAAGESEKAVAHLRRFLHEMPGATRASLKMASLLRETRRTGEALAVLQAATLQAPDDPAPHEALAELALEVGSWEAAIRHGKRLLTLVPRSLAARDILSAAFLQRGLLNDALEMAEDLARLDPYEPVHHFKRGVVLQQMGQVAPASEAFLRVVAECSAEDDDLASEARQALDMLDNFQLRQIALLSVEDLPFRHNLRRDPVGTAITKGFRLSPAGFSALMRIAASDDLPEMSPGWRHRYYH